MYFISEILGLDCVVISPVHGEAATSPQSCTRLHNHVDKCYNELAPGSDICKHNSRFWTTTKSMHSSSLSQELYAAASFHFESTTVLQYWQMFVFSYFPVYSGPAMPIWVLNKALRPTLQKFEPYKFQLKGETPLIGVNNEKWCESVQ